MFKEFRQFIMRGNVVDLAVAVVIGVAFGAVVTALVADLITPLVAAIFGKPSFAGLSFEINKSTFLYGAFINAVFSFLVIAAAIFFLVVKPMNMLAARRAAGEPPARRPRALPRVPERHPGRGAPLRVLHLRRPGDGTT